MVWLHVTNGHIMLQNSRSSRDKVSLHRERLRAQGLRPVQIWVPDVRARSFVAAARSSPRRWPPATMRRQINNSSTRFPRAYRVKRGEIWTASRGASYTGKPRPAVIVQEDRFDQTSSITLCAFATDPTDAPLLRMLIEPTDRNGLKSASRLMIDKITTVRKARLGKRIGKLNDEDTVRLNRALTVFLGLAR
jgi:mRNA interferase MazF